MSLVTRVRTHVHALSTPSSQMIKLSVHLNNETHQLCLALNDPPIRLTLSDDDITEGNDASSSPSIPDADRPFCEVSPSDGLRPDGINNFLILSIRICPCFQRAPWQSEAESFKMTLVKSSSRSFVADDRAER